MCKCHHLEQVLSAVRLAKYVPMCKNVDSFEGHNYCNRKSATILN